MRGQALPWWHPLISGDRATVHLAGISIFGRAISGRSISANELVNYIIRDNEWNR
jgi:hypothetical protein